MIAPLLIFSLVNPSLGLVQTQASNRELRWLELNWIKLHSPEYITAKWYHHHNESVQAKSGTNTIGLA